MKKNCTIKFITLLLFLHFTSSIFSQTKNNPKDYYKYFDSIIGIENTSLFNGTRYVEKYRILKNEDHKFLLNSKFHAGNILYDGQQYFGIEMKYDVYEDQVIVNIPTQIGSNIFQLIDEKIEHFSINNTHFIVMDSIVNQDSGFYEIFFQKPELILYKKHIKKRKEYIHHETVYNRFESQNKYLLYANKEYHILKSRKGIVKLFPKYRKEINMFYQSRKKMLNSDYDLFMKKFMIYFNEILAK